MHRCGKGGIDNGVQHQRDINRRWSDGLSHSGRRSGQVCLDTPQKEIEMEVGEFQGAVWTAVCLVVAGTD